MTQTWKKIATVSLAAVMLTGSLAGCGQKAVSIDKENPSINVMTKAYNTESASPDSPVLQKLEEFLGTKLNITWVPSTSYDEKVTAAMGSGEYPQVMLVGSRSSSVIQNSRAGTFWDITDKLTDAEKFPNLAQTDPTVSTVKFTVYIVQENLVEPAFQSEKTGLISLVLNSQRL